jgi:hypothetical protein
MNVSANRRHLAFTLPNALRDVILRVEVAIALLYG